MENSEYEEPHTLTYKLIMSPDRCTKRFLHASDTFISLFLITPLVVAYWHGTWVFMDKYAQYFPALETCLVGTFFNITLVLIRYVIHETIRTPERKVKTFVHSVVKFICTKLFIYAFSVSCIMMWRGLWALDEKQLGLAFWPRLYMLVIGSIVLMFLKCVRNLVAPPTVILIDSREFAFCFPTRFKSDASQDPGFYFIDCVFSVLVVGTLVIFVWRGLWVLCDLLIYPNDLSLSAWGSLAIGYGIVAITFALQSLMKWACDRLTGFWRYAVADVFLFLSFVGTVNVWRGVWNLLDIYFLPENPVMSNLLSHSVSFVFLAMLNCSNSVLVRGVYIDAEEPAGQCVIFPIYYIRLFFQKERTKKQKRILDALEKGDQNAVLLEKSDKNAAQTVKSSAKSIEMTSVLKNKPTDNGPPTLSKEIYINGEHTIVQ